MKICHKQRALRAHFVFIDDLKFRSKWKTNVETGEVQHLLVSLCLERKTSKILQNTVKKPLLTDVFNKPVLVNWMHIVRTWVYQNLRGVLFVVKLPNEI